jgi:hypothetical protein
MRYAQVRGSHDLGVSNSPIHMNNSIFYIIGVIVVIVVVLKLLGLW